MRECEARQLRSQSVVGPTRRDLEFCPRSVADFWRRWSGRNHEIAQTLSTFFSFPGFPDPQLATSDLWRFPRSAGHLGPEKKGRRARGVKCSTAPSTTVRRAGCGIPMRRDGASIWHLSSGEWRARAVGTCRWSAWAGWPRIPAIRNGSLSMSAACVGTCQIRAWLSCCTCMSRR